MAATHLPTTLTTHTVQTTTFRMRAHLLFRKEGRRQQKIKKRKITLEGLMEKRNNNDRIMCMCAGLSNAAQTGEIKRWQRDWNRLFPLITYWGGWLKFSCRYSLYGCMEIIPDALQIRPTRGTGAYHSKKVNISLSVMALCDCLSADKNVPAFCSPYRYFCQQLSDCERPNDWNSLSDLRDNSQRTEKPEKGRDGNLPIHFLFLFLAD